MKIDFSPDFIRSYEKRIKPNIGLETRFNSRFIVFKSNKLSPILRNHALKGSMKGARAFSITGDIRVIYSEGMDGTILFLDIGSHNQVY